MNPSTDANLIAKNNGIDALRELIDQAKEWDLPEVDRNSAAPSKPHPLPPSLLPVAPFSFDLIPAHLRLWVSDVCERMQCPPDFVAVSIMAAAGTVIGRKILIRPQLEDDWAVVPNQWALCIGRPGIMKSPAMDEALRPIKQLAAAAKQKFADEQKNYEVNAMAAKLRRDERYNQAVKFIKKDPEADVRYLLEDIEEEEPVLRRYITNDTTVESLGVLMQQNPNGLLTFRDEIVSLLDCLDQEDNVSQRGFYLTGWNGNSSYVFDRIGRGLHLSIEAVCLSMLGSTQPGRISQYLARAIRGGRGDDGLIQRFGMLVWPDINGEWRHIDRWPNLTARDSAQGVFKRLDELDWRAIRGQRDRGQNGDEEGAPFLRLAIDAYDVFVAWRTELERRLRAGDMHPALESHLSKYRKLVPGLALICHLADNGSGPVSATSIERAIAWAGYLETHARRAYGSVTAAAGDTARAILARIRSGHLHGEFSARDVWRPGWARLADRAIVQTGLDMLVDYDWLMSRRVETGGRPSITYRYVGS
jgi:putative DNA primase/helicase